MMRHAILFSLLICFGTGCKKDPPASPTAATAPAATVPATAPLSAGVTSRPALGVAAVPEALRLTLLADPMSQVQPRLSSAWSGGAVAFPGDASAGLTFTIA